MRGHKGMKRDFERYPKYRDNYIRAFDKMLENMLDSSNVTWKSGLDVFRWWVGDDPNQLSLFDEAYFNDY